MKVTALLVITAFLTLLAVSGVYAWDAYRCSNMRYVSASPNGDNGRETTDRGDDAGGASYYGCSHWYGRLIPGHRARCPWNGWNNNGTYGCCGR